MNLKAATILSESLAKQGRAGQDQTNQKQVDLLYVGFSI